MAHKDCLPSSLRCNGHATRTRWPEAVWHVRIAYFDHYDITVTRLGREDVVADGIDNVAHQDSLLSPLRCNGRTATARTREDVVADGGAGYGATPNDAAEDDGDPADDLLLLGAAGHPNARIRIYTKGADTVMEPRLRDATAADVAARDATFEHMRTFSREGQ